jgi:integrase
MNRYQQGSLFKLKRKSRSDVWVFRWYETDAGARSYKKQIVGSVTELRSRREAEKAVVALRGLINVDVGSPQTICDLDAHYRAREQAPGKKSFSTIENHRILFKRYIQPRWGHLRLSAIRTVEVEEWLYSLPLAPASQTKLKCVLSVLYNHAIRYEWLTFNPISRVRTSQKRLRDKDVLTPDEFQQLVQQLSVRDRAMVLLIGSTGLRRSEMIALTWSDLNIRAMEINVLRSCVRNRIGKTKTESSRRPVPLHPLVLNALLEWRAQSPYATDLDFLFPSPRFKGSKPLSLDSILEKSIRPALVRIGVVGKQIGWHSFRHSLATNLRSLGVDIKVAQELMRHSSCRTTLDIYTRAVDQQKREANQKVVELMLPLDLEKFQHPSAPSEADDTPSQHLQQTHCRRFIGGPDRDRTDDLFHAIAGKTGKTGILGSICCQNAAKMLPNSFTGNRADPWADSPIELLAVLQLDHYARLWIVAHGVGCAMHAMFVGQ